MSEPLVASKTPSHCLAGNGFYTHTHTRAEDTKKWTLIDGARLQKKSNFCRIGIQSDLLIDGES